MHQANKDKYKKLELDAAVFSLGSAEASVPDELLLLPIYDVYIMGYKDRSMYFSRGTVLNGRIVGTWKRTPCWPRLSPGSRGSTILP